MKPQTRELCVCLCLATLGLATPAGSLDARASEPPQTEEHQAAPPAVKLTAEEMGSGRPVRHNTQPVVAILDFESDTLQPGEAQALSQAAWSQMQQLGKVGLLPRQSTRNWLINADLYPSLPYSQPVAMSQVVKALQADYVLTGTVNRVGQSFTLDLTLFGPQGSRPLYQRILTVQGDQGQLLDQLRDALPSVHALIRQGIKSAPQANGDEEDLASFEPVKSEHKKKTSRAKISLSKDKSIKEQASQEEDQASHRPVKLSPKPKVTASPDKSPQAEWDRPQAVPQAHEQSAPARHETPAHEVAHEAAAPAHEAPAEEHHEAADEPAQTHAAPAAQHHEEAATEPHATTEEHAAPQEQAPADAHAPAEHEPAPAETKEEPAADNDALAQAQALFKEAAALDRSDAQRQEKFAQAIELAPKNLQYRKMLAGDQYYLKDYTACVQTCEKALEQGTKDSMLMTIKGSAHYELKQYEQANQAQQDAIALDTTNNWARYNLALALMHLDKDQAISAWNDYLKNAKDDPAHASLLAEAQRQLDELTAQGH